MMSIWPARPCAGMAGSNPCEHNSLQHAVRGTSVVLLSIKIRSRKAAATLLCTHWFVFTLGSFEIRSESFRAAVRVGFRALRALAGEMSAQQAVRCKTLCLRLLLASLARGRACVEALRWTLTKIALSTCEEAEERVLQAGHGLMKLLMALYDWPRLAVGFCGLCWAGFAWVAVTFGDAGSASDAQILTAVWCRGRAHHSVRG